jgi:hypothetical protein
MALIPQISALFDCDPPEGLTFNNRKFIYCDHNIEGIRIILKTMCTYNLEIHIQQYKTVILVNYNLVDDYDDKLGLHTFYLNEINLNEILKPLYSKEFMIGLCKPKIINIRTTELTLLLYFEIKDTYIEVYKQIKSFPKIYYKCLEYNNINSILKLIEYKLLYLRQVDPEWILQIIVDPCENQYHMIKAAIN